MNTKCCSWRELKWGEAMTSIWEWGVFPLEAEPEMVERRSFDAAMSWRWNNNYYSSSSRQYPPTREQSYRIIITLFCSTSLHTSRPSASVGTWTQKWSQIFLYDSYVELYIIIQSRFINVKMKMYIYIQIWRCSHSPVLWSSAQRRRRRRRRSTTS